MSEVMSDIQLKTGQADSTSGTNVALGVVGVILFWPALFFMDLSKADQVELEALRKRYNALGRIAADKKCGFEIEEIQFEKKQTSQEQEEEKQDFQAH